MLGRLIIISINIFTLTLQDTYPMDSEKVDTTSKTNPTTITEGFFFI